MNDPKDPRFSPVIGGIDEGVERKVKHVIRLARQLPAPAVRELAAQQVDHQMGARPHVRSDHDGSSAALQGVLGDHWSVPEAR